MVLAFWGAGSAPEVNSRQKKIHDSWGQLLWVFTKREWLSVFLSSSLGILAAESVHLILHDHAFESSVVSHYKLWVSFDDARYYVPYLTIFFLATLLALGPFFSLNVRRGLKSWFAGV